MSADSKHISSSSGRGTIVVIAGTALYFLTLLLALFVLDRQVYMSAKLEIIRDNFVGIFNLPETLNEQAREALYSASPLGRARALFQLQGMFDKIVRGTGSMYQMSLYDGDGNLITQASNPARRHDYNRWENSLFSRNFIGRTSQNVSRVGLSAEQKKAHPAQLIGEYTSPVGVPEIEKLTSRYRVYALALAAVWISVYILLWTMLLRPVRNVTSSLERARNQPPKLIRNSRGALEQGYNDLATRALLQIMEDKLNALARPGATRDRENAMRQAMAVAGEGFGAEWLAVRIQTATNGETITREECAWPDNKFLPAWDVSKTVESFSNSHHAEPGELESEKDEFEFDVTSREFRFSGDLGNGSLVVKGALTQEVATSDATLAAFHHSCQLLRRGIIAGDAYRNDLMRQRSEATIVLSRNLGHDLTNIIATTKLDLMAVRRLLDQPDSALNGTRRTLLEESVRGLLDSTRFLQEMVNVYRSLGYVKRPAYERRNLESVVDEFLQTFQPSVSSRVTVSRVPPASGTMHVSTAIIEPRLLKLALFNIMQNAADALKRAPSDAPNQGVISVSVFQDDKVGDIFEIRIEDNGPGLRDTAGNLLSPAEAQRIFEYGYSTRGEEGEGLGLSWVRTIMTEFHDGGVKAENVPTGGARITLSLKSMERKEARVGNELENRTALSK